MGAYKETAMLAAQEMDLVGCCESCETEIYAGQRIWKVGDALLCKRSCMLEHVGATTLTIEME